MKDARQKDWLHRHFRTRGWYAVIRFPVYYGPGYQDRRTSIAGIDRRRLQDGTGSVAAEPRSVVRAMMDQFGAARGLLLLKREQYPIDSDYRLFAHSPGVTLILGARGRVSIFSRSPVARRYLAPGNSIGGQGAVLEVAVAEPPPIPFIVIRGRHLLKVRWS